ncbi:hypothetical protein MNBD_NITROSPINAE01-1644 [hydrothermal vent metagenome]|uniref:Cytochrome c n=1 Tax=hydrothermal vent metagenome TaxID=652676 RepID=A0A3B1BS43_9ZZZZ
MKLFAVIFLSAFICSSQAFAMQCDMMNKKSDDSTESVVPPASDGASGHKCDMKKAEECKHPDHKKGADHKCDMKNPEDCKKHKGGTGDQAAIKADLTLVEVMQDLSNQLSRIQSGILSGNRLMISKGASAIANHPAPKGGIKPYITKNSDELMKVVKEMDGTVHKTSMEMANLAFTAPMSELHEMLSRISGGCVKCHDAFRD